MNRQELPDECPPLEALAAYLDHKLTEERSSSVEAHLLDCRKCRKLITLTIAAADSIPSPVNSNDK